MLQVLEWRKRDAKVARMTREWQGSGLTIALELRKRGAKVARVKCKRQGIGVKISLAWHKRSDIRKRKRKRKLKPASMIIFFRLCDIRKLMTYFFAAFLFPFRSIISFITWQFPLKGILIAWKMIAIVGTQSEIFFFWKSFSKISGSSLLRLITKPNAHVVSFFIKSDWVLEFPFEDHLAA